MRAFVLETESVYNDTQEKSGFLKSPQIYFLQLILGYISIYIYQWLFNIKSSVGTVQMEKSFSWCKINWASVQAHLLQGVKWVGPVLFFVDTGLIFYMNLHNDYG